MHSSTVLALAMALWAASASAADLPASISYQQAIVDARAGRYELALPTLERLAKANPRNRAYLYDWIAVLSWADRHEQALLASRALRLMPEVPDYVLAAIGKSALNMQQSARSVQAYKLLAKRQPNSVDAALGLALAYLANHQEAPADAELRRVLRLAGRQVTPLRAASTALLARDEAGRARMFQQRLLALGAMPEPTGPKAPVGEPAAAQAPEPIAVPAPGPVASPAAQGTGGLDEDAVAQERNGALIRAAEALLDQDFTHSRYRLIDQALAENEALTARVKVSNPAVALRLRLDHVVALRDRGLFTQAVSEFKALESEGVPVPGYVLNAAADALMKLRQPGQARALYQRSLASDPGNARTQTALMYAQLEAENFPGVEQMVQQHLQDTRRSLAARLSEVTMLRFTDRLAQADSALQQLGAEFQADASIGLAQADLLSQRGLHRSAAGRYRAVLAAEPANLHARVGLADATWAQGDIAETARMVAALQVEAPEHPAVLRLLTAWQRRQQPLLTSSATSGGGLGPVEGNRDLTWTSTLYNGQSEQGLRWFATHHLATAQWWLDKARLSSGSASHLRAGVGLEWTQRNLQTVAELGNDLGNGKDAVWALGAGWQLSDQLSLRARYESETSDFPLKGRVPDAQAGAPTYLHADKTALGMAYRWHESRRVAADFSSYRFNDGNQRQSLATSWSERLYSGPGGTLDLQTAAYGSANTLRDAVYFNPRADAALSATLTGDWLAWRRYDRSFNQRLSITVGSYRQESGDGGNHQTYGWSPFHGLRYEHEWKLGPDRSIRYAVGVRRFPYDGAYEVNYAGDLALSWRF